MRVRIRKDFAIHVPYVWRILKIWNLSLVCRANDVPWLTGLGSRLDLCVCLNIILDAIVVHSRKLRSTAVVNEKKTKTKSGNGTILFDECWLCCWPIYLATITFVMPLWCLTVCVFVWLSSVLPDTNQPTSNSIFCESTCEQIGALEIKFPRLAYIEVMSCVKQCGSFSRGTIVVALWGALSVMKSTAHHWNAVTQKFRDTS